MQLCQEIAPFLQRFFSLSLLIGDVPQDWKKANVHAIFKKGDRSFARQGGGGGGVGVVFGLIFAGYVPLASL